MKQEQARMWAARIAVAGAIVLGTTAAVYVKYSRSVREARFPVVTVAELRLSKRQVYSWRGGRIDHLALDNFDSDSFQELAVLGLGGIALLDPGTYAVKSTAAFAPGACGGFCSGDLVPDGKGSWLIAAAAGVADSKGSLLWSPEGAEGTSGIFPMTLSSNQEPIFFAAYFYRRLDRYDRDGKIVWSVPLTLTSAGIYLAPDGEHLPFALVATKWSRRELRVIGLDGNIKKQIPLPKWTMEVHGIAWPSAGHILVGGGSRIGVISPDGREVFEHVISNTSFPPYHGPDGTAVRFDSAKEPYLAVVSHGSSGYPRSVLLIFDPKGKLVWQEEFLKSRSMLAVPQAGGTREVLLVGGRDGVTEYRLSQPRN